MGNQLVWYEDDGNVYRFGNEMWENNSVPDPKFAATSTPPTYQNATLTITANGPIVKQVTVTFSIADPNNAQNTQQFAQTYTLVRYRASRPARVAPAALAPAATPVVFAPTVLVQR